MTQRTTVLCTNTISPMVFAIRPRLLLETRLVFETQLLLEEIWYIGGIQFLIDELSENQKLTVQFLRADCCRQRKKSLLSSKNRRFVYVCAYVFRNCCLLYSYSALFSTEYRKSSLGNWTPPLYLRCMVSPANHRPHSTSKAQA